MPPQWCVLRNIYVSCFSIMVKQEGRQRRLKIEWTNTMNRRGIWEKGVKEIKVWMNEIKERNNKGWRWRCKKNNFHQKTQLAPAIKVMIRWQDILRFFHGLTWQDVKVTGYDLEASYEMWWGHSENTGTSTITVKPPKFDVFSQFKAESHYSSWLAHEKVTP